MSYFAILDIMSKKVISPEKERKNLKFGRAHDSNKTCLWHFSIIITKYYTAEAQPLKLSSSKLSPPPPHYTIYLVAATA